MGHRRGPSIVCAAAASKLLPLVEDVLYRLDGTGRMSSRTQAWTNPAYDSTTGLQPGAQPGDAAITVKPPAELDLIEEMFPSGKNMLRRMSYQLLAVMVLIVAHVILVAYTDPIFIRSPLIQVIVYSGQGGLLLAILGSFFVLTSQTLYIRLGRYDLYLYEFGTLYVMFLLEGLLYLAMKVYATILLYRRMSYLALWDAPGYMPLWVVQHVVLVLFWAVAVYNALAVFNVHYFDPELLLGQVKQRKARDGRRQGPTAMAKAGAAAGSD